jgi:hypothetical protein
MLKIKQEILESSSLPAFQKIIKNENLLVRSLWMFCFLLLTCLSFWLVSISISSYFEHEVITNIVIIHEETPQFPMISLCIDSTNISSSSSSFNSSLIPYLNNVLKSCEFDSKKCNYKDFEKKTFYYPAYDTINNFDHSEACLVFNSGRNFENEKISIKNISSISTKLNLELYIKEFKTDQIGKKIPYKLKIYIQNYSDVFNAYQLREIEQGLNIPDGINNIQIDREIDQKLPEPYNACIKQDTKEFISNYFEYFIRNSKTYKQKDCVDFCLNEYIGQKCGCEVNIDSFDKCVIVKNDSLKSSCFLLFNEYFLNKNIYEIPGNCFKDCPLECDSIHYRIQHNSFKVSDKFLNTSTNYSHEMKDDLVFISISYAKKSYDLIKQIPKMKAFDLVSSVGGTLSLFIGVSFLTFVEIIEILFEIAIIYLNKFKNKKVGSLIDNSPEMKIVIDTEVQTERKKT